ncbi:MAG: hypothetical protein M0R73_02435 [Dehalococcoidia bacterium]|nr:hypothetical protein [Dehalococcoidia bacterium]
MLTCAAASRRVWTPWLFVACLLVGLAVLASARVTPGHAAGATVTVESESFDSLQAAVDHVGAATGTIHLGEGTLTGADARASIAAGANLTIIGVCAADLGTAPLAVLDGNGGGRVLDVAAGATVRVECVTVTGGVSDNGAGIRNAGTLTLVNASIVANSATGDSSPRGGGLQNEGFATVLGSRIAGNTAALSASGSPPSGGGVYNGPPGQLIVISSEIAGNVVTAELDGHGGGLHNRGVATIVDTQITGNASYDAAGIRHSESQPLYLLGSTVTGNTATDRGGAFYQQGFAVISSVAWNTVFAGNTGAGQHHTDSGEAVIDWNSWNGGMAPTDADVTGHTRPAPAGLKFCPPAGCTDVVTVAGDGAVTVAVKGTPNLPGSVLDAYLFGDYAELLGYTPAVGVWEGLLPSSEFDCLGSCALPLGLQVTLTPVGRGFAGWSGGEACTGTAPLTVTVNGETSCTATFEQPALSGTITTSGGDPVLGVTVTASGGHSGATSTNADGKYAITGVPFDATNVVITPTLAGYTFTPVAATIDGPITADVTHDFAATLNTYTISGTVTVGSDGLQGVTVTALDGHNGSATTDGDGEYTITGVPHGAEGITLTPALAGYTFTPVAATIDGPIAGDVTEDFAATLEPLPPLGPTAPQVVATTGEIAVPVTARKSVGLDPGEGTVLGTTAPDGASVQVSVPVDAVGDDLPSGVRLEVAAVPDIRAVSPEPPAIPEGTFLAHFVVRLVDEQGNTVPFTFNAPVTLEFTVPASTLPEGADQEALVIVYWNGSMWQEVEARVSEGPDGTLTLTAEVLHFTLFAIPYAPGWGTFDPAPAAAGVTLARWLGGDFERMEAALAEGGAFWVFQHGVGRRHIAGAPDFVNASFEEWFPDGVPAGTAGVVGRPRTP